jgi:hypothetical protein
MSGDKDVCVCGCASSDHALDVPWGPCTKCDCAALMVRNPCDCRTCAWSRRMPHDVISCVAPLPQSILDIPDDVLVQRLSGGIALANNGWLGIPCACYKPAEPKKRKGAS